MVANAAERTTRTVEKRMVFKERERPLGLKSEQWSSGREETGEVWDARGEHFYKQI